MKAKELAEVFSAMNPNDEVWITYYSKDDIQEAFSLFEYTDENDNVIDTDQYVTDDVAEVIFNDLGSDHLWETLSDDFSDSCRNALEKILKDKEEAVKDTDLWEA